MGGIVRKSLFFFMPATLSTINFDSAVQIVGKLRDSIRTQTADSQALPDSLLEQAETESECAQ